jgi:hypothetical protein
LHRLEENLDLDTENVRAKCWALHDREMRFEIGGIFDRPQRPRHHHRQHHHRRFHFENEGFEVDRALKAGSVPMTARAKIADDRARGEDAMVGYKLPARPQKDDGPGHNLATCDLQRVDRLCPNKMEAVLGEY